MEISFHFAFRLEHGQNNSKEASRTYISMRLFPILTAIIWGYLAAFFRSRTRATIGKMCPQGKQSSIGGKHKRNIMTLGEYKIISKNKNHVNLLDNKIHISDGDIFIMCVFLTYIIVDSITVLIIQAYQDHLGMLFTPQYRQILF